MENLSTWQTTKVDWLKTHNDEYSVCGAEGKDPFPIGRPLIHVCWLVIVYQLRHNIFLIVEKWIWYGRDWSESESEIYRPLIQIRWLVVVYQLQQISVTWGAVEKWK